MHERARHETPPSITLRSLLLIVFSFVASFVLAAGAVALLRPDTTDGPGDPEDSPALAAVEVPTSRSLPMALPWQVTVAATLGGRRAYVKVLRSRTRAGTVPPVQTLGMPRPDDGAGRSLQRSEQVSRDDRERRDAMERFVNTAGIVRDGQSESAAGDRAAAVRSVALLGGALGGCLSGLGLADKTVVKRMEAQDPVGLGMDRPHVTFQEMAGGDTVVAQVGILGGGPGRIAVAIVARARTTSPYAIENGKKVLRDAAEWLDKYVRSPKGYKPAC